LLNPILARQHVTKVVEKVFPAARAHYRLPSFAFYNFVSLNSYPTQNPAPSDFVISRRARGLVIAQSGIYQRTVLLTQQKGLGAHYISGYSQTRFIRLYYQVHESTTGICQLD